MPISIPVDFGPDQANAFGLPPARACAVVAGDWVGDVRRGGSLNCATLTITPHGNGTHSECVGHLVEDSVPIAALLNQLLVVTRLVSVEPQRLGASGEHYAGVGSPDDLVITKCELKRALAIQPEGCSQMDPRCAFTALVIRTLPNKPAKGRQRYQGTNPPYLTLEAIRYILAAGVQHLLLDVPSADREKDGGGLVVHREFWELGKDISRLDVTPSTRTITELVYVPDGVTDGWYLLTIQVPDLVSDALPSRPILYAIMSVG